MKLKRVICWVLGHHWIHHADYVKHRAWDSCQRCGTQTKPCIILLPGQEEYIEGWGWIKDATPPEHQEEVIKGALTWWR